jgi:hypothetical protein
VNFRSCVIDFTSIAPAAWRPRGPLRCWLKLKVPSQYFAKAAGSQPLAQSDLL